MKTKFVIFALIATLTGCANQAQASQTCQELYDTSPQSAITICQNELTQNSNNAELQFYLGTAYYLEENYTQAIEWYIKSASQGHAEAQNNLGMMYRDGRGVTQDYTKAHELFVKSANQGLDLAEYNLGVMHYFGIGIKQDEIHALEWYTKSANQGFANAQFSLGMIYYLKQDYTNALEWFTKSAEQEHFHSQAHLGMIYNNGYGTPKNPDTAKYWFSKACENGYDLACEYL